MKKICLMGGAVVNAGDFLLEKRSYDLIRHFIPDSEMRLAVKANLIRTKDAVFTVFP